MILKDIHIESTTACNSHCFMCPHSEMTRFGDMRYELFVKIVDDAVNHGVKIITPFGMGEPFLFNDIYKWLDYLHTKPVDICLFTNGSLLTQKDAQKLQKYVPHIYITISFYGYDKPTYERNTGLDFDNSFKNIHEFMLANKSIPIRIYMAMKDDEVKHFPKFRRLFESYKFNEINHFQYGDWCGKRKIVKSNLDYMNEFPDKFMRVPCNYVLEHLFVLFDGRVSLCCMDYDGEVILGDMNTQSITDLQNSEIYQYIYNKHLNNDWGDLPLCSKCGISIVRKNNG